MIPDANGRGSRTDYLAIPCDWTSKAGPAFSKVRSGKESCCSAKSSCTDSKKKGKKARKAKKAGKDQGKPQMAMTRTEEKAAKADKKAELSPAKDS